MTEHRPSRRVRPADDELDLATIHQAIRRRHSVADTRTHGSVLAWLFTTTTDHPIEGRPISHGDDARDVDLLHGRPNNTDHPQNRRRTENPLTRRRDVGQRDYSHGVSAAYIITHGG